jgi:hypothetical protein
MCHAENFLTVADTCGDKGFRVSISSILYAYPKIEKLSGTIKKQLGSLLCIICDFGVTENILLLA